MPNTHYFAPLNIEGNEGLVKYNEMSFIAALVYYIPPSENYNIKYPLGSTCYSYFLPKNPWDTLDKINSSVDF